MVTTNGVAEPLPARNDRSLEVHCKALRQAVQRQEQTRANGEVELALFIQNGRIVRRELRITESASEPRG